MSLFLSRVFYFIWQYSVDLGFFFFIVLFFGFMFLGLRIFLIGDKTFEKIFLVVYLLGISYALLWIIILSIFSTVVQKELDRYIQTVTYRVENYRIQKMKEKDDTITYYLLKTDKGTKVIDKDSLQITEEDRFTKTKQANLDKAKAELADKQAALKNAQTKLAAKQAVQADAQKALEKAQADLATAKANVEKAQAELKALQDKLVNYENADEILANAQKALVDAQAKLDKAKAVQADVQKAYDTAKADYEAKVAQTKEAETVLAKFVAQEQAQKEIEEAEAKAKAQAEAKAKNTFFYVADGKVYDEKGHIMVGYTVKGNQIFNERGELIGTLTKEPTTRMMKQAVVKANVLPQTGNKKADDVTLAGAVVTALGSVLALIGLGKRKDLD